MTCINSGPRKCSHSFELISSEEIDLFEFTTATDVQFVSIVKKCNKCGETKKEIGVQGVDDVALRN